MSSKTSTVRLTSICAAALLLPGYLSYAANVGTGEWHGNGRVDRLAKRAGKDFGTFKLKCKDAEEACNNACYYVYCQASTDPNAKKVVYAGPQKDNKKEYDQNRYESGCQSATGGSVCGNFPFSQKFIDDQSKAVSYTCDEWPPASSQQQAFGSKAQPNSLRCMPGDVNTRAGGRLTDFYNDNGGPYPGRPSGAMARDDFLNIDFDLNGADQTKLKFCTGSQQSQCGSDGFEFGLTSKPTQNGKISAPYDPKGSDNRFALQNTVYKDIFQCSIEFTRNGDNDFKNIKLFNWENVEKTDPNSKSCSITGATGTCDLKGLPNVLTLTKNDKFDGKPIGFEYDPGTNAGVNNFKWDSESTGDGRGPATNDGKPLRFCKVTTKGTTQDVQCYFPCYENADGQ